MQRGLDTLDVYLVLAGSSKGRKRGLDVITSVADFGLECECTRCGSKSTDELCSACGHVGYSL